MRQLRLVGLNDDGSRLILRDEAAKTDYLLPNDERLAAALRGDRARLGQLEISLESQIRPREMQARVRAGETPESVAKAAAIPLDKVMRLVAPVVAEREWVVEQAQKSAIRRPQSEGPGAVLEPSVTDRLAARGIPVDSVRWDARRRDDGAWVVEVTYRFDGREHAAEWTYDAVARASTPVDDEARALSGIKPPMLPPILFAEDPEDSDDSEHAAGPTTGARLVSLPGGQAMIDDATSMTDDAPAAGDDVASEDIASKDIASAHAEPAGRSRAKRASVPSWDEIMFGRRRSSD